MVAPVRRAADIAPKIGENEVGRIEIGGPSVQTPTHQSFGTRLIEHGFVGELKGEAHVSFEPSGVVCKLDIPLASLVPRKQAA